ncbi:3-keto-disaccharide hydrolase [Larkinella humicola]|uniref:DUF1080 domain-containing protein n=1 Tax=Larkinella humicola TaxID=2607654 RepID=A0A5N1JBP4_9BACT|nr:DUF1080 domain-containing protein [Larkinella humicola]KAA9349778.1 DUF1080 domain-containing protein [Larkinella humicola]
MQKSWIDRIPFFTLGICLTTLSLLTSSAADAQTTPAPTSAARPASGGGAGRLFPATVKDDSLGFVPIFDGKTLNGWDGDATFWRAENGVLIGETTPDKVVKVNNFLIWRGGKVKDFEIKFDFKINGTNSGMQYRSTELPEVGKWILKGYQADLDFTNLFTGNVHEERGRTGHVVLAKRGEVTRVADGPTFKSVAKIADPVLLRGVVNTNGWNSYHIIARGPIMIHIINNQVMSISIDEDSKNFVPEGLLGFQMHAGPPFIVQYKNILYKKIESK